MSMRTHQHGVTRAATKSSEQVVQRKPARQSEELRLRDEPPCAVLQRATLTPAALRPADLLRLQRTLGNRRTGQLLRRPTSQPPTIQAKLMVNAPGDEYEREADRVAEQVMRKPAVQREALDEEDEVPQIRIQRKPIPAADGAFEAGETFERQLNASRGQGQPLPDGLRTEFENALGADLSRVRIHTDPRSAEMNQAIQARAFTHGQDIYWGAGQYSPDSTGGKRLLAHELTHTVQQDAHPLAKPTIHATTPPRPKETVAHAHAVLQREVVEVSGTQIEIKDGLSSVQKKAEIKKAKAIIARISKDFGITLSGEIGKKAMRKQYATHGIEQLLTLHRKPWKLKELRALAEALEHYKPLLGENRALSSLAGTEQDITTFSKIDEAFSRETVPLLGRVPVRERHTFAETFGSSEHIALYSSLTGSTSDFPKALGGTWKERNRKMIRGTITHELAHGLLQPYYLQEFLTTFNDYWQDTYTTQSGTKIVPGAEAPITDYGAKNAREDLCETAMFYFEDRNRLINGNRYAKPSKPKSHIPAAGRPGNPAPRRARFMDMITRKWKDPNALVFERSLNQLRALAPKSQGGVKKDDVFIAQIFIDDVKKAYASMSAELKAIYKDDYINMMMDYW